MIYWESELCGLCRPALDVHDVQCVYMLWPLLNEIILKVYVCMCKFITGLISVKYMYI